MTIMRTSTTITTMIKKMMTMATPASMTNTRISIKNR